MLDLNTKLKKRHIFIVVVWLVFTASAFIYLTKERLMEFDHDGKLNQIHHAQLANSISPFGSTPDINQFAGKVFHFKKQGCKCQTFSDKHVDDINIMANKNNFEVFSVELEKHELIPSVPSVAILDELGTLIYFGPYGQGLGCSETSGFAKTMLTNLLKGFSANIIVREAKGCYCNL